MNDQLAAMQKLPSCAIWAHIIAYKAKGLHEQIPPSPHPLECQLLLLHFFTDEVMLLGSRSVL